VTAAIRGPVWGVFSPLLVLMYLALILGVVDAPKKSAVVLYRVGYNKAASIVVMVVAMSLSFGFIPAGYYLIVAKRIVSRFAIKN
jgi:hypothetical protein